MAFAFSLPPAMYCGMDDVVPSVSKRKGFPARLPRECPEYKHCCFVALEEKTHVRNFEQFGFQDADDAPSRVADWPDGGHYGTPELIEQGLRRALRDVISAA